MANVSSLGLSLHRLCFSLPLPVKCSIRASSYESSSSLSRTAWLVCEEISWRRQRHRHPADHLWPSQSLLSACFTFAMRCSHAFSSPLALDRRKLQQACGTGKIAGISISRHPESSSVPNARHWKRHGACVTRMTYIPQFLLGTSRWTFHSSAGIIACDRENCAFELAALASCTDRRLPAILGSWSASCTNLCSPYLVLLLSLESHSSLLCFVAPS